MKTHSRRDAFVIGFALFAMFFGAGNLIFPPFVGMGAGSEWMLGFGCYYIADIGLALIALFSIFRKGDSEAIVQPIGHVASKLLMCAIVLCIGPMLAIPRTAAMTFELSVQPLTKSINPMVFSVLFFLLIFLCSVRENSVIDIVGKVLTPLLLIGLLTLIIKGIITPLGPIAAEAQLENVPEEGIRAGYQTMDVLATMLFGILILHSAVAKGYTEHEEKRKVAVKASLVAGVMLLVVYGGLTYLGATVSTMNDLAVSRSTLLLSIVHGLLGQNGVLLFSLVVALACVTTAVGLVSSCSSYFAKLSKNRMPYAVLVGIICVFSAIVSNVGLDQIVSIAAPILDIVYPPTLVLIAMSFIPKASDMSIRFATAGALLFSVVNTVCTLMQVKVPFLGGMFGWVLPAVVFGLVGALDGNKLGASQPGDLDQAN